MSIDWRVCGVVFCCCDIYARGLCRPHYDQVRRLRLLDEWPKLGRKRRA